MKKNIRFITLLAPLATLSLCLSESSNADQVVLIGHVAPLTGAIAHLGKDNENGARLAVEEINKSGLVIGGQRTTLEIDAQDDAADPRTATQVAQKLVDDHVVAVVGHLNSGTSIPASKIYNDAGIPEISPASTNPTYTLQGFKVTYRVLGTDAQQGPALARYASETLHVKKIAVVDDATAYGQGLANEFEKAAKSLGVEVLSHDATNDKASDFRAILTKIKAEQPDAIMYGGMDATAGPMVKQMKQLAIGAKLLVGDGACTDAMSTLAGAAAESVLCSEAGMALERMPGGKTFSAKYEARFKQPIQIYSPFSYDAVYVIADAMKRAGSTAPSAILAELPSTKYSGVTGVVQFDEHGDLRNASISLFTFKSGKKTLLDVVSM
jgi:branched-chain amino acid transport system substrate-binding protein